MLFRHDYDVLVIGGGHAGAEAAWAAANLGASVAMVTMNAATIGAMSCNPAIGGLAKGQMVREIDALGGLMGRVADATGIQFRLLNASKGPAVHGPRCQSDKYRYARCVQELLRSRDNIDLVSGVVQGFVVEAGRCRGVRIAAAGPHADRMHEKILGASAFVLTTGTFMRGLMHTGALQTPGGRVGEGASQAVSQDLVRLGFTLGRLKTGTPPRLAADSIDLDQLDVQPGDTCPKPFSDLTDRDRFPLLRQCHCWITHTSEVAHDLIRQNLHRAPMYNGQIASGNAGPRYCPSIEDKVVRFADRTSHHVYLEPESLAGDQIYCNGISTSLPQDVQDRLVGDMPGCRRASILRYGYAVEYDMVWPHQIDATCMSKPVAALFLAGQINGTSGYEEAAAQGLVAGLNAVRFAGGQTMVRLGRHEAYIGVLMDDLVTKTPREPYRMFTSRAEHRLILRADNAAQRLTRLGRKLGLVGDRRMAIFERRQVATRALGDFLRRRSYEGQKMIDWLRRPEVDADWVVARLADVGPIRDACEPGVIDNLLADVKYAGYIDHQRDQIARLAASENTPLPRQIDFSLIKGLRSECRQVLDKFRPATVGQAGRLAGVNPADLMVLSLALVRLPSCKGPRHTST